MIATTSQLILVQIEEHLVLVEGKLEYKIDECENLRESLHMAKTSTLVASVIVEYIVTCIIQALHLCLYVEFTGQMPEVVIGKINLIHLKIRSELAIFIVCVQNWKSLCQGRVRRKTK